MNSKGFTLTELLVTIVVMGIITGLAFPSIRKLQEENKNEEFKAYEKVVINAAKVYMDTYSNEINNGKCLSLHDSFLINEELIKKNSLKNGYISNSVIKVTKDNEGNLSYIPIMKIEKNSSIIYKTNENENYSSCDERR